MRQQMEIIGHELCTFSFRFGFWEWDWRLVGGRLIMFGHSESFLISYFFFALMSVIVEDPSCLGTAKVFLFLIFN